MVRIDRGKIENSEFGLVNTATQPSYRVFLTHTTIDLENWSNQLSEGTAIIRLTGMLMGSGATHISGAFRPETISPDFDLSMKVRRTPSNRSIKSCGPMAGWMWPLEYSPSIAR